jgi:lipoprotein NlpD
MTDNASLSRMRAAIALAAVVALAGGCAAKRPAPVAERTPPPKKPAPSLAVVKPEPAVKPPAAAETRPAFHIVRQGETLYSIALDYGLDYRELAAWNNIDPARIQTGQQLRLSPPAAGVATAPLRSAPGAVEARPLDMPAGAAPPAAAADNVKTEPRAVRLPYSEQSYAQLAMLKPDAGAPAAAAKPETPAPASGAVREADGVQWIWPANGKVIGTFGSRGGIMIAGKLGQPVLASAAGRVIFSGTGIRGFGKLIVIRHNDTYLSVYAHNSELLVKEGQTVARGQKIAEMGDTDADQVKLHFEIRRYGKPVDPVRLLPERPA